MPVSLDLIPRILLLGRVPAVWPEPLGSWIEWGQVRVEAVRTVYAAAAAIGGAVALLVQADGVRKTDLERLRGFERLGVPRFFLPGAADELNRYRIGSWQDACAYFEAVNQGAETGKIVTSPAADRYDEIDGGALVLSEAEMRALLGASETSEA